jgi:methylglyoxal reductase
LKGVKVRYVKLGSSAIEVSVLGFGAWAIGGIWWGGTDERESIDAIQASLDSGINFIDTAPAYGKGLSENLIGKAIKGRRDKIVIATKCGIRWDLQKGMHFFDYPTGEPVHRYLGKESIQHEIEESLKRLGTDYIDLYQTHWQDSSTPIEETMGKLMELKEQGKIRAIGVSNVSIEQLREYSRFGILDTVQEKYSLIDLGVEEELLPWCKENNATMLAYSPQSKGLLTGKLSPERVFNGDDIRIGDLRFEPDNIRRTNELLEKFIKPVAEKHKATIGHITVAWLVQNSSVVALVGSRSRNQALENASAGDIILNDTDKNNIKGFLAEYDRKI